MNTSETSKDPGKYFDDKKIAVTGLFQQMNRESMEEYIKERGGKISSSITGKTDFLVIGYTLEDGRDVTEGSKYRTAIEKKVKIITEEEFFQKYPKVSLIKMASISAATTTMTTTTTTTTTTASNSSNMSSGMKGNMNHSPLQHSNDRMDVMIDNALWVDKYKPLTVQDLIGHNELARKLGDWLKNWHAVHITKTIAKASYSKENPSAKAVLLSGPPGIGKTSVATIIANSLHYEIMELNASDTRNKREIDERLVEAVSSHAISFQPIQQTISSSSSHPTNNHHREVRLSKRVVIMDEVDGMGGSDRGGIAELIKIIKIAKIPIICICNDRQSQKIKSLANHCFDLRVKRPTKTQIATRLVAIALSEGLSMDGNAAEILVEQAGNDIRAALNTLQMWATSSTSTKTTTLLGNQGRMMVTESSGLANAMVNEETDLTRTTTTTTMTTNTHLGYTELKAGLSRIEKDKVLRLSPFDACLTILSGDKAGWEERFQGFFIDYSLMPLLIQENYIDAAKNGIIRNPHIDDVRKMEILSQAADAVSDMELMGHAVRGNGSDQHWELLPEQAVFCMRVGQPIQGFQAFPSFPSVRNFY
jgi:replication factor C subunit 1